MKKILFNHTVQYLESLMNEGRLSYTMIEKLAEFSLALGEIQLGTSNRYDGSGVEVFRPQNETQALVKELLLRGGE